MRQTLPCPECGFRESPCDGDHVTERDDAGVIDGGSRSFDRARSRGAHAGITPRRRLAYAMLIAAVAVAALAALGADLRAGRMGAGRVSLGSVTFEGTSVDLGDATPSGLYDDVSAQVERLTRFEAGDPRISFTFDDSRATPLDGNGPVDGSDERRAFPVYGPAAEASGNDLAKLLRRSELRALATAPDRDRRMLEVIRRHGVIDRTALEGGARQPEDDEHEDASRDAGHTLGADGLASPGTVPITIAIISEGLHDGTFADWGVWSGSVRVIRVRHERDPVFGPREPLAPPAHVSFDPGPNALTLRAATGASGSASYVAVVTWSAIVSVLLAWALATALVARLWVDLERRRRNRRRARGSCVACGHQLAALSID
ncbi:MAG: hypothetical protein JNM94_02815 [Phycisphaerae bacterium]|nr:hypothetical protein [Phycisphaerae bacterium]